jgi:L-cysteine S-thiosulfotransferase
MAGSTPLLKRSSARRVGRRAAFAAAAFAAMVAARLDATETALRPYIIIADGIPASLTGTRGKAERGRAIVINRQVGLCLLCHSGPFPEEKLQGTLAPSLAGTGTRWSEAQLRLRLVDSTQLNPDTIMPAYDRIDGLNRVAEAFRGKSILTAEEIEDVVTYLATLRE